MAQAVSVAPDATSAAAPGHQVPARPARMPALDGLRGLAVAAVIGIHAQWLPGGWVGVDVFFTLSGFLITLLLLSEYRATGRIALGCFYRRRAARLLPAVVVLLAAVIAAVAIFRPHLLGGVPIPVLLGLTFNMDWGLLAFGDTRTAAPLEHLWSLGVEEKFYLLWAPLLALFAVRRWSMKAAAWVAGVAALLSAAHVLSFWSTAEASYARVYWSFDTRVQALLVGACVAALLLSGQLAARQRVLRLAAPFAAAVLVAVCVSSAMGPVAMVRGGLTLVAVCAGVVIAHTAVTGGIPVLHWSPLRWLGTRSYAAYLWNFPITKLLPQDTLHTQVLGVVATLLVAELSWRLVESRFLGHAGPTRSPRERPAAEAGQPVVTAVAPTA